MPYFAVFRRAAWFAAGGYAPGTEMVEDIGLFLRLINSGHDVRVLPERLARYRFRDDSPPATRATIATFEPRREQIYIEAAQESRDRDDQAGARGPRLRELRYERRCARPAGRSCTRTSPRPGPRPGKAFRQRATARSRGGAGRRVARARCCCA